MKARVLAGHLEGCANFRPRFNGDAVGQLRECVNGDGCVGCPLDNCDMLRALVREVLEPLKAQEPVEPTMPDEDNMVYCGACGSPVGYEVLEPPGMDYIRYNYCQNCGMKVKWE